MVYVPALQSWQAALEEAASAPEKVPAAHELQVALLTARRAVENVPKPHDRQVADETAPATTWSELYDVVPVTVENVPATQATQTVLPDDSR